MNGYSDCSMMDTSLQDTSALPGSFPSQNVTPSAAAVLSKTKTPMQEDPSRLVKSNDEMEAELSFIPYTPNRKQYQPLASEMHVLPRSPVFNFKSKKAVYPSLLEDDSRKNGKENGGLKFENDLLTKKFSRKLSSKVLQELDQRMNNYNDTAEVVQEPLKKSSLFSPRSQVRKMISDRGHYSSRTNNLRSPRAGFNLAHGARFDKMESIKSHYSVHENQQHQQQALSKREEDRTVRKKRRTLLGPEDVMMDDNNRDTNNDYSIRRREKPQQTTTTTTRSLDPRVQRRVVEPRLRRSGLPSTRTLDPRQDTGASATASERRSIPQLRKQPSSRTLSAAVTATPKASSLPQPTLDPSRKFSFLKPTAASMSRSVSNYDLQGNAKPNSTAPSSQPLRKSSTMHFRAEEQQRQPMHQQHRPQESAMRKSSTLSNLSHKIRQGSVVYRGAAAVNASEQLNAGIPTNSSFNAATHRPVWR